MLTPPYKKYFILLLVMLVLVACALPAFVSPTTSEVDITFNVDQASLKAGECTHLHWDVAGAVLVRLHGKELDKSGEIEICPEKTSAYTLEVNTGSRIERRELIVAVEGEAVQNIPAQTPVEPADESTDETAEVAAGDTASRLNQLGGKPCPESDFTCVTLKVPYDHFNPDGRTLEVVFGVLPATGERKGMYVTATGGPGSSGLQYADYYTTTFDPSINEHFDVVFFDQRGAGLSGGLQCPEAAAVYFRTEADISEPEGEAALADAAQTFVEDCVSEMGNPVYLAFLGTDQAVEDLEAFRAAMGDEKIWLYGESYGTQFAQTYAAAHPEHLSGLILDGVVDLSLDGIEFYEQQAQAFNDVLEMTLAECNKDRSCAAGFGVDARTAYDTLAGRLREEPLQYEFPLPSGEKTTRLFSFADLESSSANYLYSETQRMIFLRALAAYVRDGDLAPMARIFYDALTLDPETEQAVIDPTFTYAMFYAVECLDYNFPGSTPEERARKYFEAGDPFDASQPRLPSIFYGDLPCAYWPNARQDSSRPVPLTAEGITTLVLNGTADPATPYQQSLDVFEGLADGYHVTEQGGPHVIFGWGNTCVDDLVTGFLVENNMPDRQTTCAGIVVSEYFQLAPASARSFADPLEALISLDDEIYFLPEYYFWDNETSTNVGCPYGGAMSFEPTEEGEAFTLDDCAFSEGFVVTGSGSYNYDSLLFTLEVSVSGIAEGRLTYTRDEDFNRSVIGEYDGEAINISD